jgi:hypothetical protein
MVRILNPQCGGFWKLGQAGFPQNPRIIIAVKVMVKLKNLFRLAANIIYLFMASFSFKYAIYISQSASEHRRGNTSCEEQEEEQETRRRSFQSIGNSKLFYVFPS